MELKLSIYVEHDWFKEDGDDDTRASDAEVAAILAKRGKLPPHSIVGFSVEPLPPGLSNDDIPIPLSLVLNIDGVIDVYTPRADGRPSTGQNGKVKPGRFGLRRPDGSGSNGYAGILVVEGAGSALLYARGTTPDGHMLESNVLTFDVANAPTHRKRRHGRK